MGCGQIVDGLDNGLRLMTRGQRARFVVDSRAAYGADGHPPAIPGGASLTFEVEMIDFYYQEDRERERKEREDREAAALLEDEEEEDD